MVRVQIRQHPDDAVVASVESRPDGVYVSGSHAGLVQLVPRRGLPSGRVVDASQNPDEWTRGLIISFRSADLAARIVEDDDPLPEDEPLVVRQAVAA